MIWLWYALVVIVSWVGLIIGDVLVDRLVRR
jgi:hypothetical protein